MLRGVKICRQIHQGVLEVSQLGGQPAGQVCLDAVEVHDIGAMVFDAVAYDIEGTTVEGETDGGARVSERGRALRQRVRPQQRPAKQDARR